MSNDATSAKGFGTTRLNVSPQSLCVLNAPATMTLLNASRKQNLIFHHHALTVKTPRTIVSSIPILPVIDHVQLIRLNKTNSNTLFLTTLQKTGEAHDWQSYPRNKVCQLECYYVYKYDYDEINGRDL